VTAAVAPPQSVRLRTLLRGEPLPSAARDDAGAELLKMCAEQGVIGLLHERLRDRPASDWPPEILHTLTEQARADAAVELVRQHEIITILNALAAAGIAPILLKGSALAYTIYDMPSSRPRSDTDLLIRYEDVDAVRAVMTRLGYAAPIYCDGELLFRQFELAKTDRFGVHHAFDFHWKISTQSVFADILTYDELAAHTVPVAALGPHAQAGGSLHALLLACIHPVMHHRNDERLVWLYDIHLLASQLPAAALDRFAELAIAKRVAAISAHQLTAAREAFGTRIPDHLIATLVQTRSAERSAAYLAPGRRWRHELISCLQGLPSWTDRIRLLCEVVCPSPGFMLRRYRIRPRAARSALLPALYLHRAVHGLWKVAVGRK